MFEYDCQADQFDQFARVVRAHYVLEQTSDRDLVLIVAILLLSWCIRLSSSIVIAIIISIRIVICLRSIDSDFDRSGFDLDRRRGNGLVLARSISLGRSIIVISVIWGPQCRLFFVQSNFA